MVSCLVSMKVLRGKLNPIFFSKCEHCDLILGATFAYLKCLLWIVELIVMSLVDYWHLLFLRELLCRKDIRQFTPLNFSDATCHRQAVYYVFHAQIRFTDCRRLFVIFYDFDCDLSIIWCSSERVSAGNFAFTVYLRACKLHIFVLFYIMTMTATILHVLRRVPVATSTCAFTVYLPVNCKSWYR
jgi:hypothetical protein